MLSLIPSAQWHSQDFNLGWSSSVYFFISNIISFDTSTNISDFLLQYTEELEPIEQKIAISMNTDSF